MTSEQILIEIERIYDLPTMSGVVDFVIASGIKSVPVANFLIDKLK